MKHSDEPSKMQASDEPTKKAIFKCAEFLRMCLEYGWARKDIPALQDLWWKHHDNDGNLKRDKLK